MDTEQVIVPDAEREWHAVRRRIRGGVEAGAVVRLEPQRPRRNLLAWMAVPVGAAAALVFTLFTGSTSTHPVGARSASPHGSEAVAAAITSATPLVASAESIEVPGNNASTMVFVDEKSGWLMVWASDEKPKQG